MATVKGVVEGVSTKFGKYSVLVNGNWYGTKAEWAKVQPEKGDEITFDDGGGKFLKNVKVLAGGAGGSGGGDRPKAVFSNLGVELGHAANLGMQVALKGEAKPGTSEFYKDFMDQTENIFKIMKGLRLFYEKAESSSEDLEEEVAKVEAPPKKRVVEDDLF